MTAALTYSAFPRDAIVDLRITVSKFSPIRSVFPSYFVNFRDFPSLRCDECVTTNGYTIFPRPNEFSQQSPNKAIV